MAEEISLDLSPQLAMRVAGIQARLQIANECMTEVMAAYKKVCGQEQERMDMVMANICEMHGHTLPSNYEYMFDPNELTLKIRQRDDNIKPGGALIPSILPQPGPFLEPGFAETTPQDVSGE